MNQDYLSAQDQIIIYKSKDKSIQLEVRLDLDKDTLWLNQAQIARLFGTQRPAITKHLNNVFKCKELNEKAVCSILEHTADDGKKYATKFYNLDAVISVGYRVNSARATQFRIWATGVLKEHILSGYTLNQKRLLEQAEKLKELEKAIAFIEEKSHKGLLNNQARELLSIINEYAKSLTLLAQYDEGQIALYKGKIAKFTLTYSHCLEVIARIKAELTRKGEAGILFGQEMGKKLDGIIGGLYQTFGGKDLYPSIEEKSAHLFYFIIKDHPFADGNKRIGSLFFIYFLEQNNYLLKRSGERKINDNALVALALLIAESDPKEKEIMIKIITNLLK